MTMPFADYQLTPERLERGEVERAVMGSASESIANPQREAQAKCWRMLAVILGAVAVVACALVIPVIILVIHLITDHV